MVPEKRPLTEAEWPDSDELWRMLHQALKAGLFSARKQLLFCVGACRLRGAAMPAEYLAILDDLEAFADSPDLPVLKPGAEFADWTDQHDASPLRAQHQDFERRAQEVLRRRHAAILAPHKSSHWEGDPRFEADDAAFYAILGQPFSCCYGDGAGSITRSRSEADLLREIVGSPFRRPTISSVWLTLPVASLARIIFEARDFGCLPILADALEDAGCEDADLLAHCRSTTEHRRGCWAVDAVLGKV